MSTHAADLDAQSLLADILDTEQSANTICARHAISYQQLIDFLDAPLFTQFTNAAHRLSQARTKLLTLKTSPRALEALIETTTATQETRAVYETIRKSATKVLTIARQSTRPPPKQAERKPQSSEANTTTQPPSTGGTGVSPVQAPTPPSIYTPIHDHIPISETTTQTTQPPSTGGTGVPPVQSQSPPSIHYNIPTTDQSILSSTRAAKLIAAAGSINTNFSPQPEPHSSPESHPAPP